MAVRTATVFKYIRMYYNVMNEGTKNAIAGVVLVFIVLIVGLSIYSFLMASAEDETEKMLRQGCEIVGTDWRGTATNFLCPEGVN